MLLRVHYLFLFIILYIVWFRAYYVGGLLYKFIRYYNSHAFKYLRVLWTEFSGRVQDIQTVRASSRVLANWLKFVSATFLLREPRRTHFYSLKRQVFSPRLLWWSNVHAPFTSRAKHDRRTWNALFSDRTPWKQESNRGTKVRVRRKKSKHYYRSDWMKAPSMWLVHCRKHSFGCCAIHKSTTRTMLTNPRSKPTTTTNDNESVLAIAHQQQQRHGAR